MVEPNAQQLQTMKKLETQMLASFLQVCETLSLRYFLAGGTLLGAVRHGGFIPWDDDIDVVMPREDYEVFLSQGQALLPEYYFIQTMDTDPHYRLNFCKLRDSRTTFVEYGFRKYPMNHGLFIDLFPLDYYPADQKEQKRMDSYQRLFKYRTRSAVEIPGPVRHSLPVELGLGAVSRLLHLRWPDYRKALLQREALHKSVAPSPMWANYCGAWGKREIMPAEWFGEGVKVHFEGLEARAPKEYHQYLTQLYGDYMQLPPVEKRVGHHYAEAVDLEVPCAEYLREMRKASK